MKDGAAWVGELEPVQGLAGPAYHREACGQMKNLVLLCQPNLGQHV